MKRKSTACIFRIICNTIALFIYKENPVLGSLTFVNL